MNAIDCLFPNRLPKPDAEFLDVEATPARGEKMPKLVHHNQQVEQDQDLEEDEDDARDV